MIRVHVICEGQTEEMFVNQVLSPSIHAQTIALYPSLIGRPGHKGGYVNFDRLFRDVRLRLLGDATSYCTTFFDYYGLPADFPGMDETNRSMTIDEKAGCVMRSLSSKLQEGLGELPMRRFIPYVQMHEFEALLFSDTCRFAKAIDRTDISNRLNQIRIAFQSPEEINDGPETAPCKRIASLFSGYQKPLHGSLAAIQIGIEKIRAECRLFDAWVSKLEALKLES